jgi:hypothetical protein
METIGEIKGDVSRDLMRQDLSLVFTMTQDMSLTVDAYINDKKFGSFTKLGIQNFDDEAGTSSSDVPVSNLKENLEAFLKFNSNDEDIESDEEVSPSKRPRADETQDSDSDKEEVSPSKRPRVDEGPPSDKEEVSPSKRPRADETQDSDKEEVKVTLDVIDDKSVSVIIQLAEVSPSKRPRGD